MNYVDELLAEASIAAPGCPETIVERMLRTAAGDFYRQSQAWRITTERTPVIRNRREVDLELPADTAPVRVFWAKLDGEPLRAVSERNLREGEGTPRGYATNGMARTLLLDCLPTESYLRNGLEVHCAVAPTTALVDLPDELFASHRDGILQGAIGRLLMMPNVPWANLQLAGGAAALAASEQNKARREADALQAPVVRKVRYGGL